MVSAQRHAAVIPVDQGEGYNGGLEGLIFDCDGVLFDSKQANTAYYNHIRSAVQLPPMTEEEAALAHMLTTGETLDRMIPDHLKEEVRRVQKDTSYHDIFMPMMVPAPFVFEFLDELSRRGVRMALCTNRSDSVWDVLRHFGMDAYFSPVMTITHVEPKPHPMGLQTIVQAWGATPGATAFLGDSLVDQQAAAAAGIPFWGVNCPHLAARLHVSSFRDLADTLQRMFTR